MVTVIKHHYAITFITPFWHHFELSYHNNAIIFREALSNRTGLEVMKMAVVQVAPALVLMRGGLEYWWIVCSCQLGDQISSCLRSPFEKYALSCFRFYDDFLGKVLTWHKTSWMSSSWPKVRLHHFRNKLSARSFDINYSIVVAWLFQHLGESAILFRAFLQYHKLVLQARQEQKWWPWVNSINLGSRSGLRRFDGWLLSKTSAHNIVVDAKKFRTTTVCFFHLIYDVTFWNLHVPFTLNTYYDIFTPYFWQTPVFRTVGKDSQHRLSLLVRGQEEAMSAKKKWASAKAILHNATVSQNERVVVLVFAVEMGASIRPMALS